MSLFSSNSVTYFDPTHAKDSSFFTGSMNTKSLNFDPYVGGYAFIIWTKVPFWVKDAYPDFEMMTQKNFKSFDGISDIELESEDYTHTFNGNGYPTATNITKGNTDFTLRHQEFSGNPIRKMYQFWVSGIRDPRTGIATYPKIYGCDYGAKNHTGELLYIVTRPDANNVENGFNNIEFAAYYTDVFPTKIPLSHLNYSQGDHSLAEIDINFKGTMNISPKVEAYAQEKLKDAYRFVFETEFDPQHANFNLDDNARLKDKFDPDNNAIFRPAVPKGTASGGLNTTGGKASS